MRRPSPLTYLTTVLAAGTFLLSACGGQSSNASSPTVPSIAPTTASDNGGGDPEAPTDMDQATALYMKCMQDKGVSMKTNEAGGAEVDPDLVAADEECRKHMANADDPLQLDPEQVAQMKDGAIAYAKCMQGAGFDVQASAEGGIMASVDASSKSGYPEADAKCQAELDGGQPAGTEANGEQP